MPSTPGDTWCALPASVSKDGGPFLTRYVFGTDNYKVQITDLTHVWTEELSKRDIINRARQDETSINPSEDNNQFKIIMQKIRGAVDGDDDTSLSISSNSAAKELEIRLTSELPKPLHAFHWRLRPVRSQDATVSSELIIPLIRSSYVQYQRVEELSRLLADKDLAISKMLDKVESVGVDLDSIFPKMSATRTTKRDKYREIIAKNVRGMAPFEKSKWLGAFPDRGEDPPGFRELVKDAFAAADAVDSKHFDELVKAQASQVGEVGAEIQAKRKDRVSTPPSADEEEEFQVRSDINHYETLMLIEYKSATSNSSFVKEAIYKSVQREGEHDPYSQSSIR